jgi:hypothetical protein
MLTQEYRNLIDVLVQKTTAGVIHWEKGRGRFSYQAKAGDNTFKVDKYFAGDHNDACLNLAAFDAKENLVLEIVLCRGVEEQVDDYSRLNMLYSSVEQRANNGMIQQEVPVVTSITRSLQQVI